MFLIQLFCLSCRFWFLTIVLNWVWKPISETFPLIKSIESWLSSGISLKTTSAFFHSESSPSHWKKDSSSCLLTPFPSSRLTAASSPKGLFLAFFISSWISFFLVSPLQRKSFSFQASFITTLDLLRFLYFSLICSSALYLAFSRWIFSTSERLAVRSNS